jgi:hypothetical protein
MDDNHVTTGPGDELPPPERPDRREPAWESESPPRGKYFPYEVRQQDRQYLSLLAIFHYALGGLTFFCSLCPIMEIVVGVVMVSGAFPTPPPGAGGPPPFIGFFNIVFYGLMLLIMYAQAIMSCMAGYYLNKRKRWKFCMVTAAFNCLSVPFGTALGVFTIITLARESVKDVFEHGEPTTTDDEDYAT